MMPRRTLQILPIYYLSHEPEKPLFCVHQCSMLVASGLATNCQRDRNPTSLTLDIEMFQSTHKKQGATARPVLSIIGVMSDNGRFRHTKNKPIPTSNNRFVTIVGPIVGVEYNKATSRADGSPIPVRYIVEINQISFGGAQIRDQGTSGIPNTLDSPAGTSGGAQSGAIYFTLCVNLPSDPVAPCTMVRWLSDGVPRLFEGQHQPIESAVHPFKQRHPCQRRRGTLWPDAHPRIPGTHSLLQLLRHQLPWLGIVIFDPSKRSRKSRWRCSHA